MIDSVLATEVSLRRNYQDLRFCPQDHQEDLSKSLRRSLDRLRPLFPNDTETDAGFPAVKSVPYLQELLLPKDFQRLTAAGLLVDWHQGIAAALNMDEHLVLKAFGMPGDIISLIQRVRSLEEAAGDSNHPFAQDDQFGYLSFKPQLAGSGLFITRVLHLPMLHFLKQVRQVTDSLKEMGCLLKPVSAQDGRNPARLYTLSNLGSRQSSDQEAQRLVEEGTAMVVSRETLLQAKALPEDGNSTFADQVWRSYGVLQHARRLTPSDYLSHWSNLRMGAGKGILPLTTQTADELLALANDHAFIREGADHRTFVFRRADQVRRVLAGG